MRVINFLKQHWVLLLVLAIAGIAHGVNMFHFPYYENDEGTYMSQAWSLITQAKLAPYTYWYDHAPAGWILIAGWVKLTGGFFTFGASVNSGRVLMLVIHILSTYFLYTVLERLSGRKTPAVIAALIFSLSPIAIYFQRRVLLDNIMIFWVLFSLWVIVREKLKLRHVVISALLFGVSVLTKENAIFFLPAYVYVIWSGSSAHIRRFAVINWLVISGSVISIYFVYALLSGELMPGANHVSLLQTLKDQASRGLNVPFWDPRSDFYIALMQWYGRDKFLILGGGVGAAFAILLALFVKHIRPIALLMLLMFAFLLRGKLVIDFYIVPLIPLLAACIGLSIDWILSTMKLSPRSQGIVVASVSVLIIAVFIHEDIGAYNRNETWSQVAAIDWTKSNLDPDTKVATDGYAYVDYHDSRFAGDPVFPNAEWFWKISDDPDIRDKKFNDDWQDVSYIVLSHEMLKQIKSDTQPLIKEALVNSSLVEDWYAGSIAFRDVKNFRSTNGDWMSVYKLKNPTDIALDNSWASYKFNFIHDYGQVIDPSNKSTTTEGQSYAMLRALWMNDRQMFDGVYNWTRDHMQYRTEDKLFSWKWVDDGTGKYVQESSETASDADVDIAMALVLASDKFSDSNYLELARPIITSIWEKEIIEVNGRQYLAPNTNSLTDKGYLINLSYFSPAAYRIFAQVDLDHDWNKVADDAYELLNRVATDRLLPPNWLVIGKSTGQIRSAVPYTNDAGDDYGFDAFRVAWRVALDAKWFGNSAAESYIDKLAGFYSNEWAMNQKFYGVYNAQGLPAATYTTPATNAGGVIALVGASRSEARDAYIQLFQKNFNIDAGIWGDGKNYYDQNWAWFATAYATDSIPKSKYFSK